MGSKMDKIKGKAEQIEGKLTGDKVRVAQGTALRAKGKIEGAITRVTRSVKSGLQRAKASVSNR
jgi:uncharacterized protein YjbJ (UPF0337 family)